jgi:EpsI family protein
MRDYVNSEARLVNLTVVYGMDIADIHKPEYCFEGQGWKELANGTTSIKPASGPSHPARQLLLQDTDGEQVVCIYWYAGKYGASESLATQRFNVWKGALTLGRVYPSALVRISAAVTDGVGQARRDALSLASLIDSPITQMVG